MALEREQSLAGVQLPQEGGRPNDPPFSFSEFQAFSFLFSAATLTLPRSTAAGTVDRMARAGVVRGRGCVDASGRW